jgi:outer membrane protein assembly factor BamA
VVAFVLLGFVSVCSSSVRAQQPPAGKMRLAKIEVVGLQKLKQEEIVAASGLQVGQTVDVEMLDAAAEKLLASGLVTKLGYKLRERGGDATVTLEIIEATRRGNLPVVFDNFVWFTPEEIAQAVRREVPAFDGTAPESSAVIESIRHALAEMLLAKKIKAEIEYLPATTESGSQPHHVFSVKGVAMPICALSYPGSSAVTEKELIANSESVTGEDYSRESVAGFADVGLRRVYHERGYLRVKFGDPGARLASGGEGCGANGVAVTLPVEEGLQYDWGAAAWSGNTALTSAELDAALGMKAGEVANELKIDRSLHQVEQAYGRKGYLAVAFLPTQDFDDAAHRVTYRFDVREGPQYRMGALNIEGLTEAESARVRAKWQLKPGEVFDAGYVPVFVQKAMTELMTAMGKPMSVGTSVKPNAKTQTADVTITFKQR